MERAVSALKGEETKPSCAPRSTSDSISASHRSTSRTKNLRLRTYKRIAGITNEDEREEVDRELADRFGPAPPAVGNLLDYALLKGLAERILVSSIERRANEVAIKFHPETTLPQRNLSGSSGPKGRGCVGPGGTLWMRIERAGRIAESVRNVLLPLETKR